jgi:hypothetical protein
MGHLTMSQKEALRPGLVRAAEKGKITNAEGALSLGVTVRQFRRLRAAYRARGVAGLLHGNRGRASPKRLPERVRAKVLELMVGKYLGFNDSHLAEKLRTVEKLELSRERVRRIRVEAKLPAKRKRRAPKHRRRRERAGRAGELVLIDGSHHDWLEGRGPKFSLVGAIDDATGAVLALAVREQEDLHGYLEMLRLVLAEHGVPLAFYGDRCGALVRNDDHWTLEEELAGRQDPTTFGRILEELGVAFIPARSPQAKGRIERLWGTLQDRLVSELRLLGLATVEQVRTHLPRLIAEHNARFARAPRETDPVWRAAPLGLHERLSCRYTRMVARDNTVSIPGRWVQLPARARGRSWQKRTVEVRECLDGAVVVLHQGVVITREPPVEGTFTLVHREGGHARKRRPENFGPAHHPASPAGEPKPPADRRGQITNMRSPAAKHPWKRSYRPQLQPPA